MKLISIILLWWIVLISAIFLQGCKANNKVKIKNNIEKCVMEGVKKPYLKCEAK
jgi:hypothetical protein